MNVSYASTFTQELDSLPSNSIKYVFFIYLVTVLLLQCHCCCCYVKSLEGKGQWMARRVDWRIPGPFELVFMPVSARGFALFTQQNYGKLRKELELYYKWCISIIKRRWKLQLVGFSYDEKSVNVVMWKDSEFEYSQARERNNDKEGRGGEDYVNKVSFVYHHYLLLGTKGQGNREKEA